MEFGKSYWYSYEQGSSREWIITNGIGGYASGSLICSNSRRYHGLLIAALKPPTSRHLLLANLLEDLVLEDGTHVTLSSFKSSDGYINQGFNNLQRVSYDYFPQFVYSYEDIFIKKKIAMKTGENTTVVQYEIRNGSRAASFKLSPLVNYRDHHHQSKGCYLNFNMSINENEIGLSPKVSDVMLKLSTSTGKFISFDSCYFYNMLYALEQERGLDSFEDHFMPGYFIMELKPFECKTISFAATTENYGSGAINAGDVIREEERRLSELLDKKKYKNRLCRRLVLAADNFIVYRKSTDSKTVIAGYPWFTDWGRDTMIAFEGLTLVTGRYEDAKDILYTFSRYVKNGLIPNMFPDDGQQPAYNSVDAALWYFEAVYNYLEYTQDYSFVKEKIYSCLKEIFIGFRDGTVFDIRMTADGLITAGNPGTQLTWMDAKVGDWVVTPRHGKAVEINALWYNGLMIMSSLAKKFDDRDIYSNLAKKVKASFDKEFWNGADNCLYDVVNDFGKDPSIRPNQIMAVGLSYAVIEGDKAGSVVEKVWKELYTPYGLRTLSKGNPQYKGTYSGDVWSRDGAYHQGTVWTWPLGRFIKAYVRVNGSNEEARRNALDFVLPFINHLKDAGLGSISEIFDGNSPYYPRGCFAQAWSVSEILRAAVEDVQIENFNDI
ncbi:putative glycogen debranching enzyme [Ruminiclostridium sufflavum DSM 19573]|uniref:Putative glycogen debranching enzyme n=1 Tax=Ruminiclostridium sufflavum DSM 19573 TaxID=1121337 RepID=A0A318XKC7_9FIRM|nr:amylo-alpha-1,6-glucosidase [Ruminiclostridium sufflavum]PYG85877.1 putative glycogen debranching enzyme [Ruminiclostridium sufflavum DSM 19573]